MKNFSRSNLLALQLDDRICPSASALTAVPSGLFTAIPSASGVKTFLNAPHSYLGTAADTRVSLVNIVNFYGGNTSTPISTQFSQPTHGTINSNNEYVPNRGFFGQDTYTYTANLNGHSYVATGNITIAVGQNLIIPGVTSPSGIPLSTLLSMNSTVNQMSTFRVGIADPDQFHHDRVLVPKIVSGSRTFETSSLKKVDWTNSSKQGTFQNLEIDSPNRILHGVFVG